MKTIYLTLILGLIAQTIYGQYMSAAEDLTGVWFIKKQRQTVIFYPNGTGYDIAQFDMDQDKVMGKPMAQCIAGRNGKYEIIGVRNRKGTQRALSIKIKFNGSNRIKDLTSNVVKVAGGDNYNMKLVKRLRPQEVASVTEGKAVLATAVPVQTTAVSQSSEVALSGAVLPTGPRTPMIAPPGMPPGSPMHQGITLPVPGTHGRTDPGTSINTKAMAYPMPVGSHPVPGYAPGQPPKKKKGFGKKLLKGLGTAVSVAGILGVPGLGKAGQVINKIN